MSLSLSAVEQIVAPEGNELPFPVGIQAEVGQVLVRDSAGGLGGKLLGQATLEYFPGPRAKESKVTYSVIHPAKTSEYFLHVRYVPGTGDSVKTPPFKDLAYYGVGMH